MEAEGPLAQCATVIDVVCVASSALAGQKKGRCPRPHWRRLWPPRDPNLEHCNLRQGDELHRFESDGGSLMIPESRYWRVEVDSPSGVLRLSFLLMYLLYVVSSVAVSSSRRMLLMSEDKAVGPALGCICVFCCCCRLVVVDVVVVVAIVVAVVDVSGRAECNAFFDRD